MLMQNDLRDINIKEQKKETKVLSIVIAVDEVVGDRYSPEGLYTYLNDAITTSPTPSSSSFTSTSGSLGNGMA